MYRFIIDIFFPSVQRVIEGQAEKLKDLDKEIHSLRQTGEDADNIKSILESLQARLTQLETLSKTAAAWNPGKDNRKILAWPQGWKI